MKNFIEMLKEGKFNVEELRFTNMKRQNVYKSNPVSKDGIKVFEIEKEMTLEEKIKVLDIFKDGIATYMFDIINRWNEEKDSLPQDTWGSPKTVSKKAWLKRNDPRKIIDNDYKLGEYYLFGNKFKTLSVECPSTEYGYDMAYTGEHVVNQWFNGLCSEFIKNERKWFKENDPLQIKINKVAKLGDRYREVFNCKLLNDIVHNGKKDATEEELDAFITVYEELGKFIAVQTIKISQVLGENAMYKEE
jgi:hypothetical protein